MPLARRLVYSTYLGGSDFDQGNGIAVDSSGNAYVTGYTQSTDFPTVTRCRRATNGVQNGVCGQTERDRLGPGLLHLPGRQHADGGYGIAVDSSGNAYVPGARTRPTFPPSTRCKRV